MFFCHQKRKIIGIEGMSCNHCKEKIETNLESLSEVNKAKVDLNKKIAIVYYDDTLDNLQLQTTIEKLGYTVTGIKEVK